MSWLKSTAKTQSDFALLADVKKNGSPRIKLEVKKCLTTALQTPAVKSKEEIPKNMDTDAIAIEK